MVCVHLLSSIFRLRITSVSDCQQVLTEMNVGELDSEGIVIFSVAYMALQGCTSSPRVLGGCVHAQWGVVYLGRIHILRLQFAVQTLLKVTIDFVPKARAVQLINSSIFAKLPLIESISRVAPCSFQKIFKECIFFSLIAWKLPSISFIPLSSLMCSWSPGLVIPLPKLPCKSVIYHLSILGSIALIHVPV